MGQVRYVGDIEAIHGEFFTVPDDLAGAQARRYIEQLHAEQQAEAENLALEQQQAAIDRENTPGTEDTDPGELARLREGLETLHQRLEAPDTAKAADAISSTARAMQSAWSISQKLQSLEQQAREATEAHQLTLDSSETFLREVHAERDRSLAVIKNNQKLSNAALSSASKGIADLRQQLAAAHKEVGELKATASANRALIAKAGKIVKAWEQSSAASQLPPANSTEGRVSK